METIVLEIELRNTGKSKESFCFNDTMLSAAMSGLSVIYEEVFIWAVGNHIAVWAVGQDSDFLVHAFLHHREHFKKIKVKTGEEAKELFASIVNGEAWKECNLLNKLSSIESANELSADMDCLKTNLGQMVSEGLSVLTNNPVISSGKNSWSYNAEKKNKAKSHKDVIMSVKSPDLFYRFCIN
jgi:hypothetical protein